MPMSPADPLAVVKHLTAGNQLFTAALGADPAAAVAGVAGTDLLTAYREAGEALVEAFRRPQVLDQLVTVPFGTVPGGVALHLRITEVLVHGWDLARATGRVAAFPDTLVEPELAFSRADLEQIPAERRPFGPAQPVGDDAPAIDRLAACLGRQVG